MVTPDWLHYLREARDLLVDNITELSTLIIHRFSIEEAEKAFSIYGNHQDGVIKVVLSLASWTNGAGPDPQQPLSDREIMEE